MAARFTTTAPSLLARLPPDAVVAAVRDHERVVVGAGAEDVVTASGPRVFECLDRLAPGWWAGYATYELGRAVEKVVPAPRPTGEAGGPDLVLVRFGARLTIHLGDGTVAIEGDGPGRTLLERALRSTPEEGDRRPPPARLQGWGSSLSRAGFHERVRTVLELIRAGECYQVNLTRRLTCPGAADPVGLLAALEAHNPAPHSALLRLGDAAAGATTIVSASPECFLRWRGRDVETRPIKGTGTDPTALRASAKDRAENVMIVDLARNDLGRVCVPGTIHVPSLCALESHPGLHHLVSTVRGRLRPGAGSGALLRATFPPASVTGAPKPRVLQIIEELEPVPRGIYCGAVGWIDTERDEGELAVAIRTFSVSARGTTLGVGAGIVADSDPSAEWAETELKAARLLAAAGAGTPAPALAS